MFWRVLQRFAGFGGFAAGGVGLFQLGIEFSRLA